MFQRPLPRLVIYVCRHSTLSGNGRLWCFRDHSLPRLVNYVCRHSTLSGNDKLWCFRGPLPRLVIYVCRHSTLSGNGRLWCFRGHSLPRLVNYVCRHSALSGNDKLWCFRDHSLVLWTMYVDIVHYRAMVAFGVAETTRLWNTKAYHCPIVYYVYIHSSQDEGVVSETAKPIIAR